MQKIKQLKWLSWPLLIIIILSLAFYWYEWRPLKIRKKCANASLEAKIQLNSSNEEALAMEQIYSFCIRSYGLQK